MYIKNNILKLLKDTTKIDTFSDYLFFSKSNRGFHRGPRFWPPFWPPPRKPQKSSILAISDHFSDPLKPPKTPKNPQNGQNSRKWPFLTKFAFLAKNYEDLISKTPLFDPPWGDSPPPQKWPFLAPPGKIPKIALFSSFFGHFLVKNLRMWMPFLAPLARLPISNNRVIRPQIWNLRRKTRIFCTPTGAGNVSAKYLAAKNPNY